ncbi:HEAT repeat domain-containing protein [Serpentinicella alkaliphila]|uniref:HEAT repeat protein n=1 Tax=Serpentinicella alkaliphila TaxID=1734049 RepID=A0A4V2T4D1_9FIRM|nr:HEAT repeat domain-containing protein [Serpentinicella alkaliphila]QUH24518.1 HEAT repeat domain-containing protein [Serpentinicella alkaliphila]TCQ04604.1 HEAT repeat protein [Serpentinicella alkaliphila]
MDKNLIWIALISIYLLLLINGLIFWVTILIKRKEVQREKAYKKMYDSLEPDVINYLKLQDLEHNDLLYDGSELKTDVIINLINTNAQSTLITARQAFEDLGYVDGVIEKAEKKLTLNKIKQLGVMGSPKAFPILRKGTVKDDFEVVYQSCYALSLLPMGEQEAEEYITVLQHTNILRDRMIEMIKNLSLSIEVYWRLLLSQKTELGKVVLLRALEDRFHKADPKIMDAVADFLKDPQSSKEIRIASVVALAATQNENYEQILLNHYRREEAWEVRAAVAKVLNKYTEHISRDKINILKEMMYDSNWWVRFNAAEVLARKGLAGIDALVDISLNSEDKEASDLAFYILDANSAVNESLGIFEEGNND